MKVLPLQHKNAHKGDAAQNVQLTNISAVHDGGQGRKVFQNFCSMQRQLAGASEKPLHQSWNGSSRGMQREHGGTGESKVACHELLCKGFVTLAACSSSHLFPFVD